MLFMGVDIQTSRDCCYGVIDNSGKLLESGWFSDPLEEAAAVIKKLQASMKVSVGIDAPRMPINTPRQWYWKGGEKKMWTKRKGQKGNGRHCEVVISAHKLANPQWTPTKDEAPEWMQLGFHLFSALGSISDVYEVFPTASYTLLQGNTDVRLNIDFSGCRPGPKDMLDAWIAAATVREFIAGRGTEVGGSDGLGTIILPRPLPYPIIGQVLDWPERE